MQKWTRFVVYTIADYTKSIVFKKFGNVSTVVFCQLLKGGENGSFFKDSTLKFKTTKGKPLM